MSEIQRAAATIDQASYNLEYSLERQRTFMNDWLQRFQTALDEHAAKIAAPLVNIEPAPIKPELIETATDLSAPENKTVLCRKTGDCGLLHGHDGPCNEDFLPF